MNHERVLGVLIVCDMALGLATIVAERVSGAFLPGPLRAYLHAAETAPHGAGDTLLFALWVAILVSTVLAWIGLLNLLRPARTLYLASWCAFMVYVLLTGPTVMSAVGSALDTALTMVGGAILGLVYFSELRHRFQSLTDFMTDARSKPALS